MSLATTVEKSLGEMKTQLSTSVEKFGVLTEKVDKIEKALAKPNYPTVVATPIDHAEEGRFGYHNLGEQLKSIMNCDLGGRNQIDDRLKSIVTKSLGGQVTKAPTGIGEMVGSQGGFPLAPTFIAKILEIMHEQSTLLDMTDKYDITSPSVKLNANDETSRATGSRWGGIRGYWANEGDTMTASIPKWRQITLNPHKLFVLYYTTDELLADGGEILSQSASRWAAKEIAFLTTAAIISGTGSGQPLGILKSPARVTAALPAGQATKTVISQNVVQMYSQLHADSRASAVWLVNQEVEAQLPFMTIGTAGAQMPVYLPPGGLSAKPYGSMFGMPVRAIEQCPGLGTEGDIMLVDLKQYVTATRGAVNAAMSIHVSFLTDESVFRFTFRVDGQPWWSLPLVPFQGSAKQSPFVTLTSR